MLSCALWHYKGFHKHEQFAKKNPDSLLVLELALSESEFFTFCKITSSNKAGLRKHKTTASKIDTTSVDFVNLIGCWHPKLF